MIHHRKMLDRRLCTQPSSSSLLLLSIRSTTSTDNGAAPAPAPAPAPLTLARPWLPLPPSALLAGGGRGAAQAAQAAVAPSLISVQRAHAHATATGCCCCCRRLELSRPWRFCFNGLSATKQTKTRLFAQRSPMFVPSQSRQKDRFHMKAAQKGRLPHRHQRRGRYHRASSSSPWTILLMIVRCCQVLT